MSHTPTHIATVGTSSVIAVIASIQAFLPDLADKVSPDWYSLTVLVLAIGSAIVNFLAARNKIE